jgi:hypothetical protein
MCAGALVNARVRRVVYACPDPKAGAMGSLFEIGSDPRLNHRLEVRSGVLVEPCREELKTFFAARRIKRASSTSPVGTPLSSELRAEPAPCADPMPEEQPALGEHAERSDDATIASSEQESS